MKRTALIILTALICCAANAQIFESSWSKANDRIWIGPEYWAGPMQDWRIRDGKLECINHAAQRNIQLLTLQVQAQSSLEMRVTIEEPADDFRGHMGFYFGINSNQDDYRHNAIWGKGITAVLWRNGTLHLGNQVANAGWDKEVTLVLTARPSGNGSHTVLLSVLGAEGQKLGEVKQEFPSDKIAGNLGLQLNGSGENSYGTPVARFSNWQIKGENLKGGPDQNWGPILWTQYTLTRNILKLQAQMAPMGIKDSDSVTLEIKPADKWIKAGTAKIDPSARTALFRIESWSGEKEVPYRVIYEFEGKNTFYSGTIRKDPIAKESISVAGFTGNKDFGFPNTAIINNLKKLNPDLLFFSGDQIYEEVGRFGMVRTPLERATLDYLRKWYLFGWSFGEVLKDRPAVILPDDHDVYQGNLWGAGGRKAPGNFASGGYVMDPEWVRMIERTQTAHMPDPFDPTPVQQGIGVYYCDMTYGGVSFAIIEDRKFKSGPGQVPKEIQEEQAAQLGPRQIRFLNEWAARWKDAWLKATLSQTVFAQCHTYGGKQRKSLSEDKDSNGWPPAARNRSIRAIRKSFSLMYAGDNHLLTVAHHGVDRWEDAGVSFTVPSIAAGFPREWRPDKVGHERKGPLPEYAEDLYQGLDPEWIGRYTSAWGHPLTMISVANPVEFTNQGSSLELLDQKSSGFGLVRFNKRERSYTVECYRILADLDKPDEAQFKGWPVTFKQEQMYGRQAKAWLPTLKISGIDEPVVQVIEDSSAEMVYTLRIRNGPYDAKVFAPGIYTIRIGDGEKWLKTLKGIKAAEKKGEAELKVEI